MASQIPQFVSVPEHAPADHGPRASKNGESETSIFAIGLAVECVGVSHVGSRMCGCLTCGCPDIAPGLPYAVFLQNTPLLSDAVPRVGTLGWYALPRWGKWHDGVSDTASMSPRASRSIEWVWPRWCGQMARWRFRYRIRVPTDIATHWVGVEPFGPLDHHVSDSASIPSPINRSLL